MSKQSAAVDAVSGATFTSAGYAQSLQSALDKLGFKTASRNTLQVPWGGRRQALASELSELSGAPDGNPRRLAECGGMPTFLSNGRRGLLAGLLALVVFVSSAIAMTTHGSTTATAASA